MSQQRIIYSTADVARLLGVTPSAVSNYIARHDDIPPAPFAAGDGRLFWDKGGMRAWLRWQEHRNTKPIRPTGDEHFMRQRAAAAGAAVAALRAELVDE